jgi:hypothetical protein
MFESMWMNDIFSRMSSAPLPVEPYKASTSLAFTTCVKRWSSSP